MDETLAKPRVLALDDPLREPRAPRRQRLRAGLYVDVFRGLLIAHMALDHASLTFNAARGEEELATRAPLPPVDLLQFLTRFTGVPVAPGFCFMAGFMVALTSLARESRGVPPSESRAGSSCAARAHRCGCRRAGFAAFGCGILLVRGRHALLLRLDELAVAKNAAPRDRLPKLAQPTAIAAPLRP
jgi:hypothetical protein